MLMQEQSFEACTRLSRTHTEFNAVTLVAGFNSPLFGGGFQGNFERFVSPSKKTAYYYGLTSNNKFSGTTGLSTVILATYVDEHRC